MNVSVIISTRNHAAFLKRTLSAMAGVRVPEEWKAELVIVDNASTDNTKEVVQSATMENFRIRYIYEHEKGKSIAQNAGVAASTGEIILVTDDDVLPASDWLEQLALPLTRKECEAVVGRIELEPILRRPWMRRMHEIFLATTELTYRGRPELIGCNMGFHRSVLELVPYFDPELGPGALGFGEESLFSWQLCEMGLRVRSLPEAVVVHAPEPARLLRSQWLAGARARGRSIAYVTYHWGHDELKAPRIRLCYMTAKLALRRILQPPPALDEEGCPAWEMSYVCSIEECLALLRERKRPRNYQKHGLVKTGFPPTASLATTVLVPSS